MQIEYIYLDWNVIQYAKSPRPKKLDEDLVPLIENLSKRYHIPYSEAHLRDLASGYSDETKKYISEDLKFLSKITKSNAVVFLRENQSGQESIGIQSKDCEASFAEILEAIKREEDPATGESLGAKSSPEGEVGVPVEVPKLDRDDLFLKALEKNSGKLDSSVISQVLKEIWDNQNDPEFYKRFRRQVQKLVEHLEKRPNALIKDSPTAHADLMPFLKYLSLDKSEEMQEVFLPALAAFAKFSGRDFEKISMGEKIELAYGLLDFQPIFSEKVNKKNRPSNQLRDLKHLLCASEARFFVTEDAGSLEKSKIVIRALGMRVKALSVSEFVARFS